MSEATQTIPELRARSHLPFKSARIYALLDPRDDAVRYVGVTTKSLSARLGQHVNSARRGERTHAYNWLRRMLENGFQPKIITLEEVSAGGDWLAAEIRWIKYYRESGAALTNLTAGGQGLFGWKATPEQRAANSAARIGKKLPDEVRARMAATHKKLGLPQYVRDAIALNPPMLGRAHSEDARRRMGETKKANGFVPWMKGRKHTPEALELQRKGKVANPDKRPKFRTRAVIVGG